MKERDAPPDFCMQVLRLLHEAGILRELVVVGSWCSYFYRALVPGAENIGAIRTGDLDVLIPKPGRVKTGRGIPEILGDLGFVVEHSLGGYTRLVHPLMTIDFIVPERGRGRTAPVKVAGLGVNASALRFMDFLVEGALVFETEGIAIKMPDPLRYGLHKLIISERRANKDKAEKDRRLAVDVLRALVDYGKGKSIREIFDSLPKGWKAGIRKAIKKAEADDLEGLLTGEK